MKKLLFIAMIGIAGFASAKGNVEKVNSKTKEVEITTIKSNKKAKKMTKVKQTECGVFYATCTSAYTCQDWSPSQWHHWMMEIQNNYCQVW